MMDGLSWCVAGAFAVIALGFSFFMGMDSQGIDFKYDCDKMGHVRIGSIVYECKRVPA